jgi:hypothetical protein
MEIVMDMQTGSTNNHTSQILFMLAAPINWDWLVAPVLMVRYKGECHVDRLMTTGTQWARLSRKGNRINARWRPN